MNDTVDNYLINGCGRCPLGGTPLCKVHRWITELSLLRSIVKDFGLNEECKWGVPCYTYENKNVLMVSAFKNYCFLSFFKGSLLNDPMGILAKPGKNSQAARLLKFTNPDDITNNLETIKTLISNAIEIEKAGLKVEFVKSPEPWPTELEIKFDEDPTLKSAFEALTLGRQRGYVLYFSAPKQSNTRVSRIEKCIGKILNGEGMHDKYQKKR